MKDILPYYEFLPNGEPLLNNFCATLSDVCKKCPKFIQRQPCTRQKNTLLTCAKGFSVFWDIEHNKQYFSLRIGKYYDSKKIRYGDKSLKITEKFFRSYIDYIHKKAADNLEEISSVFFRNITNHLLSIKKLIDSKLTSSELCYFSNIDITLLNEYIDNLADIRQSTVEVLDSITDDLKTLLPASNYWNISTKSCFSEFEIKKRCSQEICTPSTEGVIECCEYGCYRYLNNNVKFLCFSLAKQICSAKGNTLILSKECLNAFLQEDSWLIGSSIHFQRFLHDFAQYLSGMRNLIPEDINFAYTQLLRKDIFTISVLVDAIFALKEYTYSKMFYQYDSENIRYEPYKLFDKYRICFDASGINIKITKLDRTPVETVVYGAKGFEVVVLNILLNAVKYIPPLPSENREIIIEFESGVDLIISISSYGPPVEYDETDLLGRIGYRGKFAKEYKIPGKGLGLHLIKELCKKSHYDVNFSSDEEKSVYHKGKKYNMFTVTLTIPRKNHVDIKK